MPASRSAQMVTGLKAHRGIIIFTFAVWIAFTIFWTIVNWEEGLSYFILFGGISLLVISSQVFWIRRVAALGKKFVTHSGWRKIFGTVGLLTYVFLLAFSIVGGANKGFAADAQGRSRGSAILYLVCWLCTWLRAGADILGVLRKKRI
jgi:hypothetical protein